MDARIKYTFVYRDTSIQSTYVCKAYMDSIYMCAHGTEGFSLHMYIGDTRILSTYSIVMYRDTRIQSEHVYMRQKDSVYICVQGHKDSVNIRI